MKRIKTILVAMLMVLATFAIAAAAEAVLIKSQQKNDEDEIQQQSFFDADIIFYVYDGTGCGCTPITGAFINATSAEGPVAGITDENGTCTLQMVINIDYRVTIEATDYNNVMFDFNIVDDQTLKFHMGEKQGSSSQNVLKARWQEFGQRLLEHIKLREGINNVVK